MKRLLKCLSVLVLLGLTSCSETDEIYEEKPVHELYTTAYNLLKEKSYKKAGKAFVEVERQHPYSPWSLKAQILSAYSYYQAKDYDEAIEGFTVFTRLHPADSEAPYAYYMIGLCYYEQIPILERDQKVTESALNAFQEVVSRFPNTSYAKDAKFKVDFLRNHLAGKEMAVGRFYQGQGYYLGAIKRFRFIVDNYQTSPYTPEALHRLVECSLALGLKEEAQKAGALLGHNYPSSQWYHKSYALLKG